MKHILHLSDLHVSNKIEGRSEAECRALITGLLKDLRENFSDRPIDTVFITGDIAYSGSKGEYEIFDKVIFKPLIQELQIKAGNIFLTPGNHDVNRDNVSSTDGLAESVYASLGWNEIVEAHFLDLVSGKIKIDRQSEYRAYSEKIITGNENLIEQNALYQTYAIKEKTGKIAILCLNSAIFAHGGKDDNGRLVVGQTQFQKAFDSIKRDYAKIIVAMHHPVDWLEEEDREKFNEFLHDKVDMLLCGHVHKYLPGSSERFGDVILKFQTGAFDAKQISSGYTILSLDHENQLSSGRTTYRCIKKSADGSLCFLPWTERGIKGDGEDSFSSEFIRFDSGKLAKEAARMENEINSELLINLNRGGKPHFRLIDIFDQPLLLKGLKFTAKELLAKPENHVPDKPEQLKKDEKASSAERLKKISDWEQVTFETLLVEGESYIISAGEDQGKSTILNYLFCLGLERIKIRSLDRFAIKINYRECSKEKNFSLLNSLISTFESRPDLRGVFGGKIKELLERGKCAILVDDFDPATERKKGALKEFIGLFPGNDYIIAVAEAVVNEILTEKGALHESKEFRMLRISKIKKKNIRALIEKIYDAPDRERDVAFKIITDAVRTSKLPNNHFIYTMLMEIYSTKHSLGKIFTEADIVENFIETLLQKHQMSNHNKDDPRYADILRFMGFVAAEWMTEGTARATRNDFLKMALDFNKKSNFSFPCERYIDILISSGILLDSNGTISFAQKCFMDYSAAQFIVPGSPLEELILSYPGMIKFDKIVEYYCAKSKTPKKIIEEIYVNLKMVRQNAEQFLSEKYGSEYSDKRVHELLRGDGLVSLLKDGIEILPDHDAIECSRDDDEDESGVVEPGEDAGPSKAEQNLLIFSQYEKMLSLLGRSIKSSPHMMDETYQIQIYHKAIQEYHDFMGYAMMIVEREMWPEMRMVISKYFSEVGIEAVDRDSFLRKAEGFIGVILAFVPRLVQKSLALDLGASSHQTILENIIKEENVNEDVRLMINFLKCDLEIGEYVNNLEPLLDSPHAYVKITLFFKICELLKYDVYLTEDDRSKLRGYATKCRKTAIITHAANLIALAQERQLGSN